MINKEEANRVVTKIKDLLAQGKGVGVVARAVGRSTAAVSRIKNGHRHNTTKLREKKEKQQRLRLAQNRRRLLYRVGNLKEPILLYVLRLMGVALTPPSGVPTCSPNGPKPPPTSSTALSKPPEESSAVCPKCFRPLLLRTDSGKCLECEVLSLLPELAKNGNIA